MELLCQSGAFVVGLVVALLAVRLLLEGVFALAFGEAQRGWPSTVPGPLSQEGGRSRMLETDNTGATGSGVVAGATPAGFARSAR
jgi:hypothetical protein